MQEMVDYLKQHRQDMPYWLENYHAGDSLTFDMVVKGRVGYYPGSGFDGNLVAVANKAHCVHSYLYVDYLVEKEELLSRMEKSSFQGYHSIGRIEWTESDVMPNGRYPVTVSYSPMHSPTMFVNKGNVPYCFTEILERNPEKGEEWGAKRFAITFRCADGIDTYFQLFVKQLLKAPWIFLLQDHGFGGNYDSFGKGGYLDAIVKESDIRPEYVVCAENTGIWNGYTRVEDVGETRGGMHNTARYLYKRNG